MKVYHLKISELHEHETLQHYLFPIEYGLKSLQHVVIDDDTLKYRILNGQKLLKRFYSIIRKAICVY